MTIVIRSLDHTAATRLERIPSRYSTDRVFELERDEALNRLTWRLTEARLARPICREYDSGDLRDMLGSYGDEVNPTTVRHLAAFETDRLLGLLTFQDVDWNRTLWLIDLRVREESRRKGVGRVLVRELKSRARDSNRRGIAVETQTTNFGAVSFYRSLGFRVSGFDDRLYPGEDVALFLFWGADAH